MGSKQSRSMEVLKYFDKEWQYIHNNDQGIKIYRNRDNDKEAEAHNISIEAKTNLLKQYDIYNYRRVQDNALVQAYAVQNLKDHSPNLCGNRDILKVMIQSMPIRATQLHNLSLPESLYLLSECIRGFDDCYSKVGLFEVTEPMIGLNNSGHVKVWLNENYAQNHPTHERPLLQITSSNNQRLKNEQEESLMLTQIVQIVDKKCQNNLPQDFYHKLKNQHYFADAYSCIQEYCKSKNIQIPDRIIPLNTQNQYHTGFVEKKIEKQQNDNFSFQNYTPKINQAQPSSHSNANINNTNINNGRQTLINRLPRDTLISKHQKQSRVQSNTNQTLLINTHVPTVYTYCSPNINGTPNKRIIEQDRATYQPEPKISLKNYSSSSIVRSSPIVSPRNIIFNYHAQNQSKPQKTYFVTSERF